MTGTCRAVHPCGERPQRARGHVHRRRRCRRDGEADAPPVHGALGAVRFAPSAAGGSSSTNRHRPPPPRPHPPRPGSVRSRPRSAVSSPSEGKTGQAHARGSRPGGDSGGDPVPSPPRGNQDRRASSGKRGLARGSGERRGSRGAPCFPAAPREPVDPPSIPQPVSADGLAMRDRPRVHGIVRCERSAHGPVQALRHRSPELRPARAGTTDFFSDRHARAAGEAAAVSRPEEGGTGGSRDRYGCPRFAPARSPFARGARRRAGDGRLPCRGGEAAGGRRVSPVQGWGCGARCAATGRGEACPAWYAPRRQPRRRTATQADGTPGLTAERA